MQAGEDAEKGRGAVGRGAGEAGEGLGGPDGGWGRSEEAFQGCGRVRERRGSTVVVCGPGFCLEEDCFTRLCGFLLGGDGSQLHV